MSVCAKIPKTASNSNAYSVVTGCFPFKTSLSTDKEMPVSVASSC